MASIQERARDIIIARLAARQGVTVGTIRGTLAAHSSNGDFLRADYEEIAESLYVLQASPFGYPMYIAEDGTGTDVLSQAEIYGEDDNRDIKENHFSAAAGYPFKAVDLVTLIPNI